MNLWVWRPGWDPLNDLQRQMNRLFDLTFNVVERHFWQTWQPLPTCNLYEAEDEYILLLPMPGIKAESIDVQVAGSTLTLKGERVKANSVPDEYVRRQERWSGPWSRAIQLPDRADMTQVAASLENGLLMVRVAKQPETAPKTFPVKINRAHPQTLNAGTRPPMLRPGDPS